MRARTLTCPPPLPPGGPTRSIIGEADGTLSLMRPSNGTFRVVPLGLSPLAQLQVASGDASPAVGDVTGDSKPDLLVASHDLVSRALAPVALGALIVR